MGTSQRRPFWYICSVGPTIIVHWVGCSVEAEATMIGCLPTQAIAFEWKPGLTVAVFIEHAVVDAIAV